MSENEHSYNLETCYHCGNRGLLEVVGKHNHIFGGPTYDEFGRQNGDDLVESLTWLLLTCPVCEMITLKRKYNSDALFIEDEEILYPRTKDKLVGLPTHIKETY